MSRKAVPSFLALLPALYSPALTPGLEASRIDP